MVLLSHRPGATAPTLLTTTSRACHIATGASLSGATMLRSSRPLGSTRQGSTWFPRSMVATASSPLRRIGATRRPGTSTSRTTPISTGSRLTCRTHRSPDRGAAPSVSPLSRRRRDNARRGLAMRMRRKSMRCATQQPRRLLNASKRCAMRLPSASKRCAMQQPSRLLSASA